MSNENDAPTQLSFPFDTPDSVSSAKVIQFSRKNVLAAKDSLETEEKIEEQKILERVLQRAERLEWYK